MKVTLAYISWGSYSSTVLAFSSSNTIHSRAAFRPPSSPINNPSIIKNINRNNAGSWLLSTKVGPVFEDVDGIGELTNNPGLSPEEETTKDDNILDLTQDALINPTSVVNEILDAALIDPDVNASMTTENRSIIKSEKARNDNTVEDQEEEEIEAPSVSKIIKFAIPAVGVWLCSPLLSLIDTSTVGLLSGTAQQAALNPAVALSDYSALLAAFMYTATTNLVAGAKESEMGSDEKPKTRKTLIQSMQMSGFVGVILGSVLMTLAPIMLKGIIGNDSIDPEVFSAALRYVRIRALGFPAAVIIGSAQSACLGMQDIKSPMLVLLAAAIVNFIGDMIFVPSLNPWLGGAAGAAWATVFSQYAAMTLFMKWLRSRPAKKPETVNITNAILELTGKSNEGKPRRRRFRKTLQGLSSSQNSSDEGQDGNREPPLFSKFFKRKSVKKASPPQESFSTRGFLSGQMRKRDIFQLPPLEDAKEFWPYVIPVTTTSVGRVSAYVAMSHVVSSSLGTLSMAANQVILSVFYCLCPFADSLNLTAQSFIPGIFQKKWGPARAKALRRATINFIKVGAIFGAGLVGIVAMIPLFSKFFTSDPLVIAQVNSVVPLLAGIFSIHGVICAGEGLLLGQRDLGYLGKAYGSYFFAVPYFMLRCKKFALSGAKSIDLTSLWGVFLSYQVVRVAVWAVRLRLLDIRARKEQPIKATA
jgi:Na+-driven multidrug efflux pump